jgi:transcriptional regulator with XRE-family HTH domain
MVRHHRERVGLTQAELADRIGKALETVGSIERGKSAPSFETLNDLSEALGVPVREFFGAGSYEAKAGRNDPLVRLIDRVAGLRVPAGISARIACAPIPSRS